jgi:hypothetical protein
MGEGNCAKAVAATVNNVMQLYEQSTMRLVAVCRCLELLKRRGMTNLPWGTHRNDYAEFNFPRK